jgi:hypothetical protein
VTDSKTNRYPCPHCDTVLSVQCGVKGRARCIGCQNRVLVSDVDGESLDWYKRAACPVGAVTNGGRNYQTAATHLDQSLATELIGSSRSIGDTVYAHVWLAEIEEKSLGVFIGLNKIGELPKAKARRLLQASPYSDSPFKDGPCVIRCPCRLTVVNEKKRKLEVCVLESPDIPTPVEIPRSGIDTEMAGIRGELCAGPGLNITKATLRQCLDYIQLDGEDAHDLRLAARANPAGPVYYILPRDLYHYPDANGDHSCNWDSVQLETCRYHAVIRLRNRAIVDIKITRQDKDPMKLTWFHSLVPDAAVKPEATVPPRQDLPYYWDEWGRTATFTLTDKGTHEATPLFGARLTHCWTVIKGLEYNNRDGTSRQEIFATLKHGDDVDLRQERDNPHDPFAIACWTTAGKQLGYLPRRLAETISTRNCMVHGIAYHNEYLPSS